jgi:hypothetical protein
MTPKEKIIEILENNLLNDKLNYRQRMEYSADDIIRYFAEATGYNLETLIEKEDEIV